MSRMHDDPIRDQDPDGRQASADLFSRDELTKALVTQLLRPPKRGPSIVTIEGPWGTGKTKIMKLVERKINEQMKPPECQIKTKPAKQGSNGHLSVAAARKILRQGENTDTSSSAGQNTLTAWFNAWTSQSNEQVWAGIAGSITKAARPVLCPDEAAAQRYWLARNAAHIDRFAIIRSMLLRILSPLLGLSAVIAVSTALISLAELNRNTLFRFGSWRITLGVLALGIAVVFLLAGLIHTIIRYHGPAGPFLPPGVARAPVLSSSFGEDRSEAMNLLRDPAYLVKSGYLNVVQADTEKTVRDLHNKGYYMVIFVDDLDRCSTHITTVVFEALNLFLSSPNLDVKFVIGLDPTVVAARLDDVYKDLDNMELLTYGDDLSAGWALLRKMVELPVATPGLTAANIDRLLKTELGLPAETVPTAGTTAGTMDANLPANEDKIADQDQREILDLMTKRVAAQPGRSAREIKRLINVWHLYRDVLNLSDPVHDDAARRKRHGHLAILAEIITRWPALQRQLNQSRDGQRGLRILATACANDEEWSKALKQTELDNEKYERAVTNLRELLRTCNGEEVAKLAAKVL